MGDRLHTPTGTSPVSSPLHPLLLCVSGTLLPPIRVPTFLLSMLSLNLCVRGLNPCSTYTTATSTQKSCLGDQDRTGIQPPTLLSRSVLVPPPVRPGLSKTPQVHLHKRTVKSDVPSRPSNLDFCLRRCTSTMDFFPTPTPTDRSLTSLSSLTLTPVSSPLVPERHVLRRPPPPFFCQSSNP